MRKPQSLLSTFVLSVLATAVWSFVSVKMDSNPWQDALKFAPFFFALIFGTMLATNRLSIILANRMAKREAAKAAANRGPVAPVATSERVEHNQRRRQRADRARAERRRR